MCAKLLSYAGSVFETLSGRYCVVCEEQLSPTEEYVCGRCLAGMHYVHYTDFYDNPVNRLFWGRIPIERTCCLIPYRHEDDSHRLLVQLKYMHQPMLGRWLGRMMAHQLMPRGFFEEIDLIVPVPLHWLRWLHRGYNQSTQLALGIQDVTGLPVCSNLVRRIRNNATQTSLSNEERSRNVEGIFRAHRKIVCKHVLLVDDVLTTGSTLVSLAQAILKVNPDVRFSVLTLAKA